MDDTHHYHVRSTLGPFGTRKQGNKRSLRRLSKIFTENSYTDKRLTNLERQWQLFFHFWGGEYHKAPHESSGFV